ELTELLRNALAPELLLGEALLHRPAAELLLRIAEGRGVLDARHPEAAEAAQVLAVAVGNVALERVEALKALTAAEALEALKALNAVAAHVVAVGTARGVREPT